MNRDEVYRNPRSQIVDFVFDDAVADAFPDMIRRSVPGYELVVPMTGLLAARTLSAAARPVAYDLGCSLGATTLAVLRNVGALDCRIFAVDNAAAMLERAHGIVDDARVTFLEADVASLDFEPCTVVLMNWLQQFLPPPERLEVLERIRRALEPRGLLVVSEKIRFDDPDEQVCYDEAHLDFKRANGYSELEISQKRTALENVMILDTEAEHRARFADAGFGSVRKWFQCLNWASFMVRP